MEENEAIAPEARGQVYVADIDTAWRFHSLFVNGERQQNARSINSDSWRNWTQFNQNAPISFDAERGTRVMFGAGELDGLDGNTDTEVVLMPVIFWNHIPVVTQIDAATRTAYLQSKVPSTWPSTRFPDGGHYNILNALKYLDEPGEWSVDSQAGKVYFWPKEAALLETASIVAPKPYELLRLQGDGVEEGFNNLVSHIHFDGLAFYYTDRVPENEFPDEWIVRNSENPDASIFMEGTKNCRIMNSEIAHSGAYGVAINQYGQNNEILHNRMHDLGSGGVQLYGYGVGTVDVNHHNIVMGNSFFKMGVGPYQHSPGIQVFGSGINTLTYNYIAGAPYAGISIVGTDENSVSSTRPNTRAACDSFGNIEGQYRIRFQDLNELPGSELDGNQSNGEYFSIGRLAEKYQHSNRNVAEYNYVEDFSQLMDDGGALYSWYAGLGNVYAYNNLSEHLEGQRTYLFTLYMDDRALGFTLQNNLVTGNINNTINKSFVPYDNRWNGNNFAKQPAVPAGYDAQLQKILDTVSTSFGGFNMPTSQRPQFISPANGDQAVKIPTIFSWSNCENASSYSLELAKDADFTDLVLTKKTRDTVFTTGDLSFDTTYYARITSKEFLHDPQISDRLAFKTDTEKAPMEVPTGIKLSNDIDAVLVQWNPIAKTKVNVYRKAEEQSEYSLIGEKVDGSGFLDSQVTEKQRYTYKIAAVNEIGEGPLSLPYEITIRGQEMLFSDHFDEGVISDRWTDLAGNVVKQNPTYAQVVDGKWEPGGIWQEFFVGRDQENWDDYAVEADITFKALQAGAESYSGFGLITRASGNTAPAKAFYQFVIRTAKDQYELQKLAGGGHWVNLGRYPATRAQAGEFFRMRLESAGKKTRAYLNGIMLFETEDEALKKGGIGFGYGWDKISIDNVRVVQPKKYEISIHPDISNGSVLADRNIAIAGQAVTLTLTPDEGYRLKPGSLKINDKVLHQTIFPMPDESVSVEAEFEKIPYSISLAEMEHGTLEAECTEAPEGSRVSVTVLPDAGYRLTPDSIKANGVALDEDGGAYSFVMPAETVILQASFEELPPTLYNVGIAPTENGTISASVEKAVENESVILTVKAAESYRLKAGSLKANAILATENADGTYHFVMPAADVSVAGIFEPIPVLRYKVTLDVMENGTLIPNHEELLPGELLSFEVRANAGYRLKENSLTVNGEVLKAKNGVYSLLMPEGDVSVKAVFEAIPPIEYSIIEGADASSEEGKDLVIVSDGPFALFVAAKVNGSLLTPDLQYTVHEGSTVLTLKATYLDSLLDDTYLIELLFADGSAQTTFTVPKAVPVETTSSQTDHGGTSATSAETEPSTESTETTQPSTDGNETSASGETKQSDGNTPTPSPKPSDNESSTSGIASVSQSETTQNAGGETIGDKGASSSSPSSSKDERVPKTGESKNVRPFILALFMLLTAAALLNLKKTEK